MRDRLTADEIAATRPRVPWRELAWLFVLAMLAWALLIELCFGVYLFTEGEVKEIFRAMDDYAAHMEERATANDSAEEDEEERRRREDGPPNDDWLSEYYGGSTPQTDRERQIESWKEKRRIG